MHDRTGTQPPETATQSYASENMSARRERIAQAARQLLEEGGDANLTIRKLADTANVGAKTIYRAFGDRDGVILAALRRHVETVQSFLEVATSANDIPSISREFNWHAAELFRGPGFARIIFNYYFSADPREETVTLLRAVALKRTLRWLNLAEERNELENGVNINRTAFFQVDAEFAVWQRWASGRIADEHVADELRASFLTCAASVTSGETRKQAIDLLNEVNARLPVRSGML